MTVSETLNQSGKDQLNVRLDGGLIAAAKAASKAQGITLAAYVGLS